MSATSVEILETAPPNSSTASKTLHLKPETQQAITARRKVRQPRKPAVPIFVRGSKNEQDEATRQTFRRRSYRSVRKDEPDSVPWRYTPPPSNAASAAGLLIPSKDAIARALPASLRDFTYSALPLVGNQVRMIRLSSRSSIEAPIECEMEVHELSSSLLYQALSYTWQDST
jgi:hypothetical protein